MNNDNRIFKSYKQRLISMNARNSSFFLGKINNKRHLDLVEVAKSYKSEASVYDKLLQSKKITFNKLIVNPDDLIAILDTKDENYKSHARSILPQLTNEDFNEYNKLKEDSNDSIEANHFIRMLIKKYEKENNSAFTKFNTLIKNFKKRARTTGKTDLYIGFPFIEGKIGQKEFRGPLVLQRVEISVKGRKITVSPLLEGRILNPVFLLSYINENELDFKNFDFELPETKNFNYYEYAIKFLKEEGINVTSKSHDLLAFDSLSKSDYRLKYFNDSNTFKIRNNAVIGMFPISSQNIYNDLDLLDKDPANVSEALHKFLLGSKTYKTENNNLVREEDIKYISPLDWSQRLVVASAMEDDLVIEGPPGTGKSQTIVNLIINLLNNNKSVLVISEKVAAIDVVYNRLDKLRENALLIDDHITNKRSFFEQVLETNKNIKGEYYPVYKNKIDLDIAKYIKYLQVSNESNFYNEFSFSDVLNYEPYLSKIDTLSNNKTITNYIDKVKKRFGNIKYELTSVLSEENIDLYKEYQILKKSDLYKSISSDDLEFLIREKASNNNYKEMQVNYYLLKTNQQPLLYTKRIKIKLDKEISSYKELNEYTNKTYNKYSKHLNDLSTFNTPLYKELKANIKRIEIALKWNDSKDRVKLDLIASLRDKPPRKCIIKFLSKKPRLTEDEKAIYSYYENYSNNFDKNILTNIKDNFDTRELKIYLELLKLNVESKNDIKSIAVNATTTNIKDSLFKNLYKNYLELVETNAFDLVTKYNKVSSEVNDVIKKAVSSKYSLSEYKNLIIAKYIGRTKILEAMEVASYLKDNNKAYYNVIRLMNNKYNESLDYTYNYVKRNINEAFSRDSELYNNYTNLVNQSEQKRKKSVRQIFKRYERAIRTVYPVILMTPDVASTLFPLEKGMFDYVIFDEASQMFVEKAVPAINRAKQVVVAGDSKQLRPSSTFTARYAESDDALDDDKLSNKELEALDKESLLDMAKGKYESRMLQVHYRSNYKELIEFSGRAFYDNKLFFASKNNQPLSYKPVEVINVTGGLWSNENTNEIEALEVVRLVKEILKTRENNETIGIITFNIKQKALIQKLLEDTHNKDILKELDRINVDTLEDESMFVKNIENVQGDERDIIIFSIGYARDVDGHITAHFGSLSLQGGENRLNVAITRAKNKVYVVKSINARDLRVNMNNPGPRLLKQYLEYVEYTSNFEIKEREQLLNNIYKEKDVSAKALTNSSFIDDVYDELRSILSNEYRIIKDLVIGNYLINFAIYDNVSNKYLLGIKTDNYMWQAKAYDRAKDFHSEQYLESRGWKLHKILELNWQNDKLSEMNKLRLELDRVKGLY